MRSTKSELASLVDVLLARSEAEGRRGLYTFLREGEEPEASLSFSELDLRARALGAVLAERRLGGKRILLLHPPGLEFVVAFFGCLYAGAVAIPAYPPGRSSHVKRLSSIVADAEPALCLTSEALLPRLVDWLGHSGELAGIDVLASDELATAGDPKAWRDPGLGADAIAFLQYTSGSTSAPRGVEVSHANLLANEEAIHRAFETSRESVIVSWLPLYHDMGLIGGLLQPLYAGACCVLFSPAAFIRKPLRWLQAISRYRGTTSGAPDFAYDLCVRRIPEKSRHGLDLSSWRVAFNGAEPVRARTLELFAETFAEQGFRRQAFYPCYGLAEATLFVSGGAPDREPVVAELDGEALRRGRVAAAADAGDARTLVGSGKPAVETEVRIVDPESRRLAGEDRVGEIWVRGPGVARGYRDRESGAEVFGAALAGGEAEEAGFLRTGDLGFLRDGELFVTGRRKDLVIVRGRNHYPQDVELTAELASPLLRPGASAVFAAEVGGKEEAVLLCESNRQRIEDVEALAETVRGTVAEAHDLRLHEIVFLRKGTLPRTSSGKVQRHACRQSWLEGTLTVVARSRSEADAEPGPGDDIEGAAPTREALAGMPPAEGLAWIGDFVRRAAARAARRPAASVSGTDSLISLGLDSLAAVELVRHLEEELAIELELPQLLDGADLDTVADRLRERLAEPAAAAGEPRPALGEEGEHPLSDGQRALWFLHRLAPESAAYHITVVARAGVPSDADAPLDVGALSRAWEALVRRHPALRSTFVARDGEPRQRFRPAPTSVLERLDAAAWSDEELRRQIEATTLRPFDLEHGPLARATLIERSDEERIFHGVLHHLIADFTSTAILAHDLGRLYNAFADAARTGEEPVGLPAPPRFTPADVAAIREERLARDGADLLAAWRRRLAGVSFELFLPTDRPRPAAQSFAGASRNLRLGKPLAEALGELARRRGTTRFILLAAAFEVLLHRLTGEERFVLGTPSAGRDLPQSEGVVGYFVNPLVLRADADGNPTFEVFLERTRQSVLASFALQALPFPRLAEALLGATRELDRSPIFQVMLVYQQAFDPAQQELAGFALGEAGAVAQLGDLRLESMALRELASPFDLVVRMAQVGEADLALSLQYRTDLFDATTVLRFGHALRTLLGALTEGAGRPLSELPLFTSAERHQLVVEDNDPRPGACPAPGAPRDEGLDAAGVHELFAAQAQRRPGAVALRCGEDAVSYGELRRRVDELARHLRGLGVGPEVPVALILDRRPELVVAMLAVLEAGGFYVPVDPAYPAARRAFMLEDSGARVVLRRGTASHGTAGLAPGARIVDLDLPIPDAGAAGPEAAPSPVTANHLAYLIYTSGSTGRPKGVAIRHGGVLARCRWARRAFRAEELSGVVAATSVCFDLSAFEILVTLALGGTVLLAENALELPRLPARSHATLVNTVPSAASELVRSGGIPAGVRTVSLAGEPLPRQLAEDLHRLPGVERVLNLYGPSEDTTYSTGAVIAAGTEEAPAIGRPLDGTRVHVLGPRGETVPSGVPGELYLGGPGLARGYYGRPGRTATSFVPDALARDQGGERLYRTGDRVRRRRGGELEFLGRGDRQVKLRGFRIELAEVEAALVALPPVQEAAVLVHSTSAAADDARLVAYVVLDEAQEPSAGELRTALAQRLPGFMVPSTFCRLPALPLLPNGKVDRAALRRLALPEPVSGDAREEPRGEIETAIAALWQELLVAGPVGRANGFFELGGHSLSAARLAARLSRAFGVEIPVRRIFEAPTVAAQARAVEAARQTARRRPPLVPAESDAGDGSRVLSFSQERLWFLDRLQEGTPEYNMPAAARISGPFEPAAFAAALDALARRHEPLRTRLLEVAGRPRQVVAEAGPLPVLHVDLRGLDAAAREDERRRLSTSEAWRPFDLGRGPLLRARVLALGEELYQVILVLHHAAADGWSLGVLARELGELYAAARAGRAAVLPALPVSYAEYAAWQRRWLAGEALESELAWWHKRLDGAPRSLELPADRPRPARRSVRGGFRNVALPAELVAAAEALGRRRGATLFMVLLASFETVLSRLGAGRDFLLGTPVANRPLPELEGLIGFFVNLLVLRADLGGDPSFEELVGRVRERNLELYAHQDLPFEKLVEALEPQRDLSRPPLVQVLFALQNAPLGELRLEGAQVEVRELRGRTSKLDLSLELVPADGGGLGGGVEYSRDLYDATTVERFLAGWRTLLEAAVENPAARRAELPSSSRAERHQLLVEWGAGAAGAPAGEAAQSVLALLREQAARTPERIAVRRGGRCLSYGELHRRARRLATRLRGLDLAPEETVGLLLDRSEHLPTAILGVFEAGVAYVAIDPAYPAARRKLMLADGAVRCLVVRRGVAEELAAELPGEDVLPRIAVEDVVGEEAPLGEPAPDAEPPPESLAYILFTSGSTGRPKGVAIRHGAVLALCRWAQHAFSDAELAEVLLATSACFDLSVFETLAPLVRGGTVTVAENALEIASWGESPRLSLINTVPSAMAELVRLGAVPPSVRVVALAGEPLSAGLVEAIHATTRVDRVCNLYGPSEDTTYSTWATVAPGERPPIGRPLPGTRASVLDRGGLPVPLGAPGELLLGGAGLARGYFGRPAATAERFVPDPFVDGEPGGRLYRTGDLVRWRRDGELLFLGRLDHQVKVRGFRIELGEIEAAIEADPTVAEAVALVDAVDDGGARLVAVVRPDAGGSVDPEALLDGLRSQLPAYMVPAVLAELAELPRLPNGKLDRGALLRHARHAAGAAEAAPAELVAPRTPAEELVAGIWSEVLGLGAVGVESDFFRLGGHSLLAARVVSRIRETRGVELPVRRVFESPTVAALAADLDAADATDATDNPIVRRSDPFTAVPLGFAQERLWVLERLQPGRAVYNVPVSARFRGALRPEVLAAALAALVRRHEALRTRIAEEEGRPMQHVLPPDAAAEGALLPRADLDALSAADRERQAGRLRATVVERPFDLGAGRPWRALLLRRSAEDHELVLVLHHVVSDGWSLGVIAREIGELCAAGMPGDGRAETGRTALLPRLAVQPADFVLHQRRRLSEERLAPRLARRCELLGDAPRVLELPVDRPRPAVQSGRGGAVPAGLEASLTGRLEELARRSGATLYMVLLAAFEILLGRLSGQRQVLVGTPIANRPHRVLEPLVGCFANTLVLRGDLRPDPRRERRAEPTFVELLGRVRETVLEAHADHDLPFERLVEKLAPQRDLSRAPIFQALLAFQNVPLPEVAWPGCRVDLEEPHTRTAKFDLSLWLRPAGGAAGVTGFLEYDRDLFDATTAGRWWSGLVALLEAVAEEAPGLGAGRPLGALPLWDAAARHQTLVEWNAPPPEQASHPASGTTPDPEALLHDAFLAHAARSPGGEALVVGEERLDRGELERRSAQLAGRLAADGVGPGAIVGLALPRGVEMVVAMLAVLRAGGAYLPLDPAYPAARLRFMVEDTGAGWILLDEDTSDELVPPGVRCLKASPEGPLPEPPATPRRASPDELAYVIYTSGSTGKPKGVMISHRNALSFFAGMDDRVPTLGPQEKPTWLATTSISFDISLLELLWTLSRGWRVVLHAEEKPAAKEQDAAPGRAERRAMDFSLFYFASDSGEGAGEGAGDSGEGGSGEAGRGRDGIYRLLLEGARFADRHGFTAVWTPERHFHAFGGLYPNPAVTGAAVAAVTERLAIRAGSVVLPLHNPVRVAEEWSVVDNLSGGRAAVSIATGWHADDFVLAPDNFQARKDVLLRHLETIQALWRGEVVEMKGGVGQDVRVRLFPPPVQDELPIWMTAAGNPETFRAAGELGANLLTHLLGQSPQELGDKIAVYRAARRAHPRPGEGHVSLMLHTYVGEDLEEVRQTVRRPFREYLRSSAFLLANLARGLGQDFSALSAEDMEVLLDRAFERYFETSGLFGTPETCLRRVRELAEIGVDEVACLIDFGVPDELTLAGLEHLDEVRRRAHEEPAPRQSSPAARIAVPAAAPGVSSTAGLAEAILLHGVTHLQCTPSQARILLADPRLGGALGSLRVWLLGGEPLTADLAAELRRRTSAELRNMYGPTETTVWSSTAAVDGGPITVGRPIRGTALRIVDADGHDAPSGAWGELWIGGPGVARGYHARPATTAERFVPDPACGTAAAPGARAYRTGDLARVLPDGRFELRGRLDHQVKVSGHRIEPGEIEAVLASHAGVGEAVVGVRGDAGAERLVAWVRSAVPRPRHEAPSEERERLLTGRRPFPLPNGLRVAHHDAQQARALYDEVFAEGYYERHGIGFADGDVIFDVGANTGFFSMLASQRCAPRCIHAFEPIPTNFEILEVNTALYGDGVELHNSGVASRPGSAEFVFYPHAAGLSGRFTDPEENRRTVAAAVRAAQDGLELAADQVEEVLDEYLRTETFDCPLTTLSEEIRSHGLERVDYLKVDVEGAEVDVLAGLDEEDWPKIGQIVLEVHSDELLATCRGILEAHGFETFHDDLLVFGEELPNSELPNFYVLYGRRPGGWRRPDGTPRRPLPPVEPFTPPTAEALRAHLAERLPAHLIPSAFVHLEEMPRTPNGKLDRRALPDPQRAQRAAAGRYVAPRSALEQRVAAVWREVLGVEAVGLEDNFFEAGGTSLTLVQAGAKLEKSLGRAVPLVEMFRYPTVATLASYLEEGGGEDGKDKVRRSVERAERQAAALRTQAEAPPAPPPGTRRRTRRRGRPPGGRGIGG